MSTNGLSVAMCLNEIGARLIHAAAIARAAVTCAESEAERAALRIALDLYEVFHEAAAPRGAMILPGRIRRRSDQRH